MEDPYQPRGGGQHTAYNSRHEQEYPPVNEVDVTSQDMEAAMARSDQRWGYMSTRNQSVAYNTLK